MKKVNRFFVIVLDSFGIGELPDAAAYGDEGSNTLAACYSTGLLKLENFRKLGLYNIDGVTVGEKAAAPAGSFARLGELSKGKDSTIGHWEISGIVSNRPLPTYPNGFPKEIIEAFEQKTGRKAICNLPYSGTAVIDDYGEQMMKEGALIVYTSGDSVFQIAAHTDVVPLEELYRDCKIARALLQGEHAVGRVIARPFVGTPGHFTRTAERHDYSLLPPGKTILDAVSEAGLDMWSIGKIEDIFAGRGITRAIHIKSNEEGMNRTIEAAQQDFHGFCFTNLVDFDTQYGHRNDPVGYSNALNLFDRQLGELMSHLRPDDAVILTADHGCDPITPSTDHSREYIPMVAFGGAVRAGVNLGTRWGFGDIGATVAEALGIAHDFTGNSFWQEISNG